MNPYPGLRSFNEADHNFFFGREQETDDLIRRLTERRFLAVLGVSGCGKSSLVRAGLIPLLRSGLADGLDGPWRIFVLSPGNGPIQALNRAIGAELDNRSHALRDWAAGAKPGEKLILLVDQFEEIFGYRSDLLASDGGNTAALFVDLLLTAASDPEVPLYVVITMRTDFLGESAIFRELPEALNEGSYLVPRLTRLQQRDAICRPSEACGVTPQPALVQRLLNDAEEDPDKLPVLQHLLKRLWESHQEGILDLALYDSLGGWGSALDRDIERTYCNYPDEQGAVCRLFQWITDPGTGDKLVRRPMPVVDLPLIMGLEPDRVQSIVDSFVERDFLRIDASSSGKAVDLMHESIMWQWRRLQAWIRAEAADAQRLGFYREAAARRLALGGATLEEAHALAKRIAAFPQWAQRYLDSSAEMQRVLAWIADSERRQANELRTLRRGRRQLVIALVAAVSAVAVIGWLWWRSYVNQRSAEMQLAQNYWQTSREAQEKGQGLEALHYAAAAIRLGPAWMTESVMLDIRNITPSSLLQLMNHSGRVNGAVFSSDERRVLSWSSDQTANLWDARTGLRLIPALQHDGEIHGAQFSSDESLILTWGDDAARIWDSHTGHLVALSLQHAEDLNGASFNPLGDRVLTWSDDGTARLWHAHTGRQQGPSLDHGMPVKGALFSHDGSRILTWTAGDNFEATSGDARIWDARTGQLLCPPLRHKGYVLGAQFSRDEARVLTWSEDGTARLWDSHTGRQLGASLDHDGAPVLGAGFNRDESLILTRAGDPEDNKGVVRIWDAQSHKPVGPFFGLHHEMMINGAEFTNLGQISDRGEILTVSSDFRNHTAGEAQFWYWNGSTVGPAMVHRGPMGVGFNADGTRILSWSEDHMSRLWDTRTSKPLAPAFQHAGPVGGARLDRDENRVLTWSDDGGVRLWEARTHVHASPIALISKRRRSPSMVDRRMFAQTGFGELATSETDPGPPESARLSMDGKGVLTCCLLGARLWDARTGREVASTDDGGFVSGATLSRDTSRLLSWGGEPNKHNGDTASVWDTKRSQRLCQTKPLSTVISGARFSRDEREILAWDWPHGAAWLWDAQSCQQVASLFHEKGIKGGVVSQNADLILTWSKDDAKIWTTKRGPRAGITLRHAGVQGAEFSQNGDRLLTWSGSNTVGLWDTRTGRQLLPALANFGPVTRAEFFRDQSRIVTWNGDRPARVWDARTGRELTPNALKSGDLGSVFNQDQSKVLAWRSDGTARIREMSTGRQLGPTLRHKTTINGAQFSGNDNQILTWDEDTARIWDTHTGKQLGRDIELLGFHVSAVLDGSRSLVLTESLTNAPRIWHLDADLDFPAAAVSLWIEAATGTELDLAAEQVRTIDHDRWRSLLERYNQLAAEHAKICRYPEANQWLRFHGSLKPPS